MNEEDIKLIVNALNYEASTIKMFYAECTKEGQEGSELQKRYQFGNNVLVNFREKINIKYLEQFKDRNDPTVNKIYTNEN